MLTLQTGRALLGLLILVPLALPACSKKADDKPSAPESRSVVAETGSQDPNAENPDRDRWLDLATVPFRPEWVGGKVVVVRRAVLSSMNAVSSLSSDVASMHKFLLGAPLLMERADRGPAGIELEPYAAAGMPEDAPDHLSQVWTLRSDLTWEDGKPLTAKDYAFAFDMIRNKDVASPFDETFDGIASVEALDATKLRVRWKQPSFRAIESFGLDFPVVPSHALPADGASFKKAATHLACGPYRIAGFEPSGRVELVLRDEYRKKPFPIRPFYVERFVFEPASTDPTAVLTRLINGEVHVVGMKGDQYAAMANDPAFKQAAWRSHFVLSNYSFIVWNMRDPADPGRPHPVLADVRVRKALSHLVPLELLVATTYHGLARPVSGPFDFRDAGYDPAVLPYAFDPAAARALLKEAGWTPGDDGTLTKDGRPLAVRLSRHGDDLLPFAQAMKDEARKVGVRIDLDERKTLLADLEARKLDAGMLIWKLDSIEPDVSDQWHSRFATGNSYNYTGFADKDVDASLDRIRGSFEPAERATLRRRIHRRIHDEAPCSFLIAGVSTVGFSKRVANVKVHDLGIRYYDFVMRDRWK